MAELWFAWLHFVHIRCPRHNLGSLHTWCHSLHQLPWFTGEEAEIQRGEDEDKDDSNHSNMDFEHCPDCDSLNPHYSPKLCTMVALILQACTLVSVTPKPTPLTAE